MEQDFEAQIVIENNGKYAGILFVTASLQSADSQNNRTLATFHLENPKTFKKNDHDLPKLTFSGENFEEVHARRHKHTVGLHMKTVTNSLLCLRCCSIQVCLPGIENVSSFTFQAIVVIFITVFATSIFSVFTISDRF